MEIGQIVSYNFAVEWYEDSDNYDRTGHIFIGSNIYPWNPPNYDRMERFVAMAFYDSTPGDSGDDLEIRVKNSYFQSYSDNNFYLL